MAWRRDFRGARCLVTGASSGLGEALARGLAASGSRVVMTGRSAESLARIAEELRAAGRVDVSWVEADLTREADRLRVFEAASRFGGALDLVVNAAGAGAYGRFESHPPEVLRVILDINLIAAAEIARGTLPLLRRGERASLVNIGSIVARRGLPGRAEYSASKFALAGLTEALRAEWAIDGIHVLLVNPGFTRTAFERNLMANTALFQTPHLRTMTADQVAAAILRAVSRGKNEVTLTSRGRLLLAFNRALPRLVDWGLGRWTRHLYGSASPPAPAAPETTARIAPEPGDG